MKELQTIPLTKLRPNPHNPRKDFDPQALRQMVLRDLENTDCTRCWKIRDCAAALKKRGYEVQLKHAVDLVKKEESG